MTRHPVDTTETLIFNYRDARIDFVNVREDYRRE
jgi:hypothetical protein